jgi:GTP-binding protein HflX
VDGLREGLGELLGGDRIRAGLELPLSAGRLHARLKAAGAIAGEAVDEHGWHLDIDAPRSVLAPLLGDDVHAGSLRDLIDPPHAGH